MAIAKKNRFISDKLNIKLNVPSIPFPVEAFKYNNKQFTLLGESNKDDLFPSNIEEPSLISANIDGRIGQFLYSSENGDLYDVLLYVDEFKEVILYKLRTRLQ